MEQTLFSLLIKYHASLVSRDFIIDYFVESDYMTEDEAILHKMIRPGKLFLRDDKLYVVTRADSNETFESDEISIPESKLGFYDKFILNEGMIENFTGSPVETTLGVYILNYIALVKPFGNIIPYYNGYWELKKIEKVIAKKAINGEITAESIYNYVDCVYSLSSLNDFCVPAITEKAITSNPEVTKRRNELFEQYKDRLDDPNVMVMIEDELIKLDKSLLKGDDSTGFLIKGKNYNVQRKRMFLMMGLLETFGDEQQGYNFGKSSLNDGWNTDEMNLIANEIRRGSYSRATQTALGGAQSKMLGRNFQDSAIVADDCGSKRGLKLVISESNKHLFVYRNIIEGNTVVTIDESNINSYIGKEVELRSPMYCLVQHGYCYTCMDSRFKSLGIKLLNIYPINIGSTLLTMSLKSVHGTKVDLFNIDNLNELLL